MAPLVHALARDPDIEAKVCVTAQHREMLDQVLTLFSIVPDYDLNIMKPGQGLTEITCRILQELKPILESFKPDVVLVHGDNFRYSPTHGIPNVLFAVSPSIFSRPERAFKILIPFSVKRFIRQFLPYCP